MNTRFKTSIYSYTYMGKTNEILTRAEFYDVMKAFTKDLGEQLNGAFAHVIRRLESIELRMDRIEQHMDNLEQTVGKVRDEVHYVKNDTRLIGPMFESVRMDGAELWRLKIRVDDIEKRS